MKTKLTFLITLLLICIHSIAAIAEDNYVEYTMRDPNGRVINTNIYSKDGNRRMDIVMAMRQMKITTTSLMLKSNPEIIFILNSLTNTYTKKVKPKTKPNLESYTITAMGKEKVGSYNCSRVRVKSKDKLFDMWFTKDLPALNLPIENNPANIDKKLAAELEQKGVSGMMVKTVYFNPGTTTPKLTMELKKYESKPLSASLFKIPGNYKETTGNVGKNMSPEKKREMMKLMMEQLKSKQ